MNIWLFGSHRWRISSCQPYKSQHLFMCMGVFLNMVKAMRVIGHGKITSSLFKCVEQFRFDSKEGRASCLGVGSQQLPCCYGIWYLRCHCHECEARRSSRSWRIPFWMARTGTCALHHGMGTKVIKWFWGVNSSKKSWLNAWYFSKTFWLKGWRSVTKQLLMKRGHVPCLLPKFHPELNPIERVGSVKALNQGTLRIFSPIPSQRHSPCPVTQLPRKSFRTSFAKFTTICFATLKDWLQERN